MFTPDSLPARQFTCRLEELSPIAKLAHARYLEFRDDFTDASTDFGAAFETSFAQKLAAFEGLLPARQRILTAAEQTRRLNAAAKALRHPLNRLDIHIGAAGKARTLTVAPQAMGLGPVREAINNRNLEGLDRTLGELIGLVEVNAAALADRGMKPQALLDLRQAHKALGGSNTTQDAERLGRPELTATNIEAGNALWAEVAEILRVGRLLYKETNKKRAATFTLARLLKLMRSANEGAPDAGTDETPA